jgi:hypothetical protein
VVCQLGGAAVGAPGSDADVVGPLGAGPLGGVVLEVLGGAREGVAFAGSGLAHLGDGGDAAEVVVGGGGAVAVDVRDELGGQQAVVVVRAQGVAEGVFDGVDQEVVGVVGQGGGVAEGVADGGGEVEGGGVEGAGAARDPMAVFAGKSDVAGFAEDGGGDEGVELVVVEQGVREVEPVGLVEQGPGVDLAEWQGVREVFAVEVAELDPLDQAALGAGGRGLVVGEGAGLRALVMSEEGGVGLHRGSTEAGDFVDAGLEGDADAVAAAGGVGEVGLGGEGVDARLLGELLAEVGQLGIVLRCGVGSAAPGVGEGEVLGHEAVGRVVGEGAPLGDAGVARDAVVVVLAGLPGQELVDRVEGPARAA